jgi:FkbM family methyltransferase
MTSAAQLPLHDLQQKATCSLPRMAEIRHVDSQKGSCSWKLVDPDATESCVYDLVGTCKAYVHTPTGCTFFGWPEFQYPLADTTFNNSMLEKPFKRCDSRPRYFLVTEPPLATAQSPLALMAGGTSNVFQDFVFVLDEVTIHDTYRLKEQKAEDMKLIVDIGANVGLFSISACKRFPNARILAFEPHPANFQFLKANLAAAGCDQNVETFRLGLSKDGRDAKLFWLESIGTSAYRKSDSYVNMKTISVDSLWNIVGPHPVSLMKVDCEGCEYSIVPLIQKSRVEQLFCEVHDNIDLNISDDAKTAIERACRDGNSFKTVASTFKSTAA